MTAAFRKRLIFEMQRSNTETFEFLNCTTYVQGIPITCVGIGNNRNRDRFDNSAKMIDNFAN